MHDASRSHNVNPRHLTFRLLGSADLRDADDVELRAVLVGPKRLALLAFLALTSPHFQRRDIILSLFWPDLPLERARSALRSSLHKLRAMLGDGVILSRGDDELALNRARFRCDAIDFQQAAESGHFSEAMAMYRGDLLAGFHVGDLPELDRWLEERRTACRRLAVTATRELVADASREHRWQDAAHLAQRALELDPVDEHALLALMEALAQVGDRAGALAAFNEYDRRVRLEYDTQPSDRALASAARLRTPATATAAVPASPASLPRISGRLAILETPRALRLLAGTGVVVAALVTLGVLLVPDTSPVRLAPGDTTVVAVLPFRTRDGIPEITQFGGGLAALVTARLSGGGVESIDRGAVSAATRRIAADPQDMSVDEARAVGRRVGAHHVVVGSVVGTAAALTVTTSVIDVASGAAIGDFNVVGPSEQFGNLGEMIAKQILSYSTMDAGRHSWLFMRARLPELRAMLEGRQRARRGEYARAVESYERALQADSVRPLAALVAIGMAEAAAHAPLGGAPALERATSIVARLRDSLVLRDRAMAATVVGERYPVPDNVTARRRAAEHFMRIAPDWPQSALAVGDAAFHRAERTGQGDSRAIAGAALRRAIAADSAWAIPLEHLISLAVTDGDTASVRALSAAYLRLLPNSEMALFIRWRAATVLGSRAELAAVRAAMPSGHPQSLIAIAAAAQHAGVSDAAPAARIAAANVVEPEARWAILLAAHDLAVNLGQARVAAAYADSAIALAPNAGLGSAIHVADVLYAAGPASDRERGRAALARVTAPPSPGGAAACIYALARGYAGVDGVAREIADLRTSRAQTTAGEYPALAPICADLLAARAALERNDPSAGALIARADSASLQALSLPSFVAIELARLSLRAGDTTRARRALSVRSDDPSSVAYLGERTALLRLHKR
jgi:DNA-binding SARP family transcriptional activator/TolB-like protein